MPTKLYLNDDAFEAQFKQFLHLRDEEEADVSKTVRDIIDDVREHGDAALFRYTEKFDHVTLTPSSMVVDDKRKAEARAACPDEVKTALTEAAKRIEAYHQQQFPSSHSFDDTEGVNLGWRWTPIREVGLYVPGGRASYPSSVLMNAIPAKVAGCERIAMVVPTPDNEINPAVLVAAEIAGVDEIYTVGGAQAVAALAYGTQSLKPVHLIVGPGNAYVAEAKRQVFGKVGIDMIAGPSEIMVVADNQNDPRWIAADLLSQAEHDAMAQSVLITDDDAFADAVIEAVEELLSELDREAIARESWEKNGGIFVVEKLLDAVPVIDEIAPEHLELAVEDPDALFDHIHNAGAIFMGRYTPEAVGDYVAGPSHVLPTSRTARFSSGLSVNDFVKRTSIIGCSREGLHAIGTHAANLADSEGLGAHALSVRLRMQDNQ